MKNLLIVFLALLVLVLASCRKEGEEPVAVEGVSLPDKASVVLNGTYELKATVSPSNATDKSLTWASDNIGSVTVDQNGVVTGKTVGKAIITATSKSNMNKSAKCEVEVVKEKAASITITPEKPEVVAGKTLELKATVLPAEAAQSVTWSSGDKTKATIDAATGVVTGVEAGETTITATATDGSNVKKEVKLIVQSDPNVPKGSITGITLGTEKIVVGVPKPGASLTLSNAPRTIADSLTEVRVDITAAEGAIIKIGEAVYTKNQKVNFTSPVTFSLTEEGKTGSKDYTLIIKPYNKSGNPYGIYTVAHLQDMRNALGGGFILINDIAMPAANAAGIKIPEYARMGWLPIGDETNPFTGSLDGGGKKITDFFTDRAAAYIGLFGKVGSGASIKNLGVIGITGTETKAVKGSNASSSANQYTGILAGYSEGTIENCYTTGNVSTSSSSIHYGVAAAGGLAGWAKGQISNCSAAGNVSVRSDGSPDAFAGGLVGYSDNATITGCYTTGKVYSDAVLNASSLAGGLVGNSKSSTFNKCYAAGDITSTSGSTENNKGAYAGGLIGRTVSRNSIDNSYVLGNVSASASIADSYSYAVAGGLVGRSDSPCSISNLYVVGNVSSSKAKEKFAGGLTGIRDIKASFTSTNCYRNSDATIKWDDNVVKSDDKDITPKTLAEMKTEAFKGKLNEGQTTPAWGYSSGKNSALPYLIGVGDGK